MKGEKRHTVERERVNELIADNQDSIYSLFMKAHKCYDLIPLSTKLVVFDTHLPVSLRGGGDKEGVEHAIKTE